MKKQKNAYQSGFTLIEAIVVIVVMAILAVGLSMGLVRGVQNYVFASQATQLSQKAQVALARINKELIDATAISYFSSTEVDYSHSYSPPSCQQLTGCQYSIKMQNNNIYLQGISPAFNQQVLVNNVATFTLTFTDYDGGAWAVESGNTVNNLAKISVSLILTYGSSQTLTFNTTVNPRQGSDANAPNLY